MMKGLTWKVGGTAVFFGLVMVVLLWVEQTAVYADPVSPPLPGETAVNQPYIPPLKPPPPTFLPETTSATETIVTDPVWDMKVLVIRSGIEWEEGIDNTATAYLDILGVPYDVLDLSQPGAAGELAESDLWDGVGHGHYYAIFITTSTVWWALDLAEQTILTNYSRDFQVRQVTWYAYPSPDPYGLDFVSVVTGECGAPAQGAPFNAALTAVGADIFHYLKPDISLPIDGPCLYGYLATPTAGADVTPLLLDGDGHTFLALRRYEDGREHLIMTMGPYYPAIPPAYLHARVLPYGLINWATKGVFLGERHVYFVPQPDDILGWGDSWDVATHAYIYDTGYRNTPADLDNLVAWQTQFKATAPNAAGFRIEMPFNGEGSASDRQGPNVLPGTLTAKAMELEAQFTWLNHTYSHRDLDIDEVPYPDYTICGNEIINNTLSVNNIFHFTDYSTTTLLTGDYSGINPPNPDLASAAYNLGVRYMLANASLPGYNNPTPNTGIPHPLQPAILLVPRYANNIYYAVTTPAQEVDLYNIFYCPGYVTSGYTTPCFDYAAIMDSITNQAFGFMLDYSLNPTMFHMNNIGDYGGGQTLMTDFIEALYGKYNALYGPDVPVLSLRTQEIGQRMRARMAYNASGVSGQLACGNEVRLTTSRAATIPLTGITYGSNTESYAGQPISYVAMGANSSLLIPGEAARVATAVTDLTATRSANDVVLAWSPTSQDTTGASLTAVAYRIYARANDPYFTPTAADLLAEVSSPTFTHLNGAGNVADNYTYLVTAVGDNCWRRESALSNRVGEFDFVLSETNGPDFNWIALPLDAGLARASDLKAHIESQASAPVNVMVIEQWIAASQNYQTFIADPDPFGDFDLQIGGVYRVAVDVLNSDAVTWTLVGRVPEPDAFSYTLRQTNSSDFNWLMLPLSHGSETLASLLQTNIETHATAPTAVFTIEQWNVAGQNYQTYISQPEPFGDFPIRIGYPYRLSIAIDTGDVSTWP
jgi:hypothetical protein